MAVQDLEGEVLALRARMSALVDEVATNERLLKKNQQRELALLKADNLEQLFSVLCKDLVVSYGLDSISVVLSDADHQIRHLLLAEQLRIEQFPEIIFTDNLVSMTPQFRASTKPWLGPYVEAQHQQLFNRRRHIKSIALIPLLRQRKLYGSLNFGSADSTRFERHLATDFLAHLGVIAAVAIENAMNRARLVRSGVTDFLTGWHNRRYLQVRLNEELARAQREHTSLVYCIIDVDHFKQINDEHGHLAGDAALRTVAERISQQIRSADVAARFGGDEFVVLAPALSFEKATILAERIRQAVCAIPVKCMPCVEQVLSVSMGVAVLQTVQADVTHTMLAERLLAVADTALYQAKQTGRNRAVVVNV